MDKIFEEAQAELQTICDVIRWASSQFEQAELFFGHGTDNAWDEAAFIVLSSLGLPPDAPSLVYQSRLTTTEKALLMARLYRRVTERVPAAYLVNQAWFAGMNFYVDERVLVPRSPLAEMIEQRFPTLLDDRELNRIADVCTGSACIACALAEYFPEAKVDAYDISPDALAVAKVNVENHGLEECVELIESDLLDQAGGRRYELIVANPPYVGAEAMANIPAEYRAEPELGLAAGIDGLDLIPKLLQQASECLTDDGVLVVEVGASMAAMMRSYPNLPLTWLEFERGGEGVFAISARDL